jgi:dethiobiotin synthetase
VIVIVVGTGTDVGKTHVSCALLAHAARAGMRVSAWKPVVSGASPGDGDHVSLAAALGAEAEPPLFTFADPISPHLCARRAGVAISVDAIAARALELEAGGVDALLVETAGGLFSPLGQGVFTVDLCLALPSARVLLVAPDRLGVLHDVAATLLAGQGRGLAAPAVALSAPALPDASTGTNARELAWALGVEVAAVFPRASMDTPQIELAAAEAWRALRAMRPGGEPRSAAAGGAGRATPAAGGPGSPGAPDALREVAELLAADRAEPRGHGGVDTSGALRRLARAHDALLDAFWQGLAGPTRAASRSRWRSIRCSSWGRRSRSTRSSSSRPAPSPPVPPTVKGRLICSSPPRASGPSGGPTASRRRRSTRPRRSCRRRTPRASPC